MTDMSIENQQSPRPNQKGKGLLLLYNILDSYATWFNDRGEEVNMEVKKAVQIFTTTNA